MKRGSINCSSLARLSTNYKLTIVESCGHDIPGEAPEAVVNGVLRS